MATDRRALVVPGADQRSRRAERPSARIALPRARNRPPDGSRSILDRRPPRGHFRRGGALRAGKTCLFDGARRSLCKLEALGALSLVPAAIATYLSRRPTRGP